MLTEGMQGMKHLAYFLKYVKFVSVKHWYFSVIFVQFWNNMSLKKSFPKA